MSQPPADRAIRLMKFVTVFECGGTERQFLNLGLALDRRGFDLQFGCLRGSGRLLSELGGTHIPLREYRMHSFYSARFLIQQLSLARDLARDRVDIVHAYNLYGNVFAVPAARMAGVPAVIAAVRDLGVYLDGWKRRVQRTACLFADLVLVNADSIKDWLVSDGYPPDKIVVIRNGINLSRFSESRRTGRIRHELGIPAGAPLLSTIARLCPSKGAAVSIDAMPMIHARHPDARLLIVGEGLKSTRGELHVDDTFQSSLAARARALGVDHRVIFTGYRPDIPDILRDVDVSMQPSYTEGLSNSVLEAMAAGVAVVATPVGGTPEVLRDDEHGCLTPVGDARALAGAVCALIEDPARRARLGRAARELVHARFSVERMVEATERVYRDLLERKRRRRMATSDRDRATRPWDPAREPLSR
jgi:glycosyltransferase involved in cell wall biosynthesis